MRGRLVGAGREGAVIFAAMVYCVVPRELEGELFERLEAYYADDLEVTVIVDRRFAERRGRVRPGAVAIQQRVLRDRRRRRVVGEFPHLVGEAAHSAL